MVSSGGKIGLDQNPVLKMPFETAGEDVVVDPVAEMRERSRQY